MTRFLASFPVNKTKSINKNIVNKTYKPAVVLCLTFAFLCLSQELVQSKRILLHIFLELDRTITPLIVIGTLKSFLWLKPVVDSVKPMHVNLTGFC